MPEPVSGMKRDEFDDGEALYRARCDAVSLQLPPREGSAVLELHDGFDELAELAARIWDAVDRGEVDGGVRRRRLSPLGQVDIFSGKGSCPSRGRPA